MLRHVYFVTPCGYTHAEAQTTIDSVIEFASGHPDIAFDHLVVFNNGLSAKAVTTGAPDNYRVNLVDLGTVGSRAAARNHALDSIQDLPAGLVCFLDAGDLVLASPALDVAFASWASPNERRLWAFSAVIVGEDIQATRRPRALWLRKINNPFLIGATYASSPLATSARFAEGAKEDWKYWLELVESAQSVTLHDEVAYQYQVVSTTDHLRRKRGLWRQQYRFFSDYLGYGHGLRTSLSMLAHMMIAGTAWVRRSTRIKPWRKTS